jgi:hypothetical protein
MPYDDHTVPIEIWKTLFFDEDTVTYENAPVLETQIGSMTIDEDKRWSADLEKSELENEIENGKVYLGLTTDLDNSASITFDSQDDLFNPPKLVITYSSTNTGITQTDTTTDGNNLFTLIFLGIIGVGFIAFLYYRSNQSKGIGKRGPIYPREQNSQISKGSPMSQNFCMECGSRIINPNSQFCDNCGRRL